MIQIGSSFDRQAQLKELAAALLDLIAYISEHDVYTQELAALRWNLAECNRLLHEGFTQPDLSRLSRQFRPFLDTHKDWIPPLERLPDGGWQEPDWYPELEARHARAREAAFALRVMGEY
jgi:hypothetical protein